jgi:hypothetical protein
VAQRVHVGSNRRSGHPSVGSTAYGGYTRSSQRQNFYQYEDPHEEADDDGHYRTDEMTHHGARLVNGKHRQTGPVREAVRVSSSSALVASASRAHTPAPDAVLRDGDPHEYADGGAERPVKERSDDLTPEEAWYMLRALIGQQIDAEEKLLWRLKRLDQHNDRPNLYGAENGEE